MSLTKPIPALIIKKQYVYKLKAYLDAYFSLVVLQVISLLFSFSASNSSGFNSGTISIDVSYYSIDIVIVFTMIWGFITAIQLTSKGYRNNDFSFVTNRACSNMSNGLFLLTASAIGGITAMLTTFLQKILLYYIGGVTFVYDANLWISPHEFILSIGAAILYVLLFSALGYMVGTLVQLHKSFAFIIPASFYGVFAFINSLEIKKSIFEFFFREPSFAFFSLKNLIIIVFLFTCASIISNRSEVRS